MAFKITVWTEDNSEYDLDKKFKTRQAANRELDDILEHGSYLGDYQIDCGTVVKTDDD